MREPETLGEYVSRLSRTWRITIGVVVVPMICLMLVMCLRELATRNSKTFQDVGGLIIVFFLSALGPVLSLSAPRAKVLHWLPVILAAGVQFFFLAMGKPMSEWWLYFTVAPFTVGAPAMSLILFKRWYAPRFEI